MALLSKTWNSGKIVSLSWVKSQKMKWMMMPILPESILQVSIFASYSNIFNLIFLDNI